MYDKKLKCKRYVRMNPPNDLLKIHNSLYVGSSSVLHVPVGRLDGMKARGSIAR